MVNKQDFGFTPEKQLEVVNDLLTYRDFYESEAADFLNNLEIFWQRHLGTYSCKKNKDYPWKGCYSKDTEVLTDKGWLNFENITLKDKVFSKNVMGFAEYMPISDKQKVYYEKMIRFESKSVDLMVSPDHNMYLENQGSLDKLFLKANQLMKINGGQYKIPLTSIWCGTKTDKIYGFSSEDWFEFLGWYISEGYLCKQRKGKIIKFWNGKKYLIKKDIIGQICISQSQEVNAIKCREIENLLNRMGVKWHLDKRNRNYCILLGGFSKEAKDELNSLGRCWEKYIPRKYLDYDKKYLSIMLDSLIKGDGCRTIRENRNYDLISYYTTSKLLADNIQELVQKIGLRATIHIRDDRNEKSFIKGREISVKRISYEININYKNRAKVQSLKRSYTIYNDYAYCVTTPYHTLYVRRNGIACWCGNSADIRTGVISYFDSALEARFNASLNSQKFVTITAPSKAGRIAANACSAFINDYWKPKANPVDTLIDWFQNIVVEGVALLKINPAEKNPNKRKRYKIVELAFKIGNEVKKLLGYATDENKKMILEETDQKDYLGCLWEATDISQCGFDLSVDRLKKGKFFYQEIWLTKSDCKKREKEKGWQNIDKVFIEKDKENKGAKPDNVIIENQKEDTKKDYSGTENTKLNKEKFLEFWIEYDVNDDDIDESCYFILHPDKKILNYWSYNKFSDKRRPYTESQFYRIAGQIIGQGNPQRLGSLSDELDTIQNQKIDNSTRHNCIGGTYIPDKQVTESVMDKFVVPGKWLPVTTHKQIDRWIDQSSLLDLQSQENFTLNMLERKSLVSDYSMGRESSINTNPTARGTAMILKEFSINIDPLVRNIQIAGEEAIRQTLLCFYETMPAEGIKYTRDIPIDINAGPNTPPEQEKVTFRRENLEFMDEFTISFLAGASDIMADSEKQIATVILQAFGADESGEVDTFAIKKHWLEVVDPILAKDIIRTPQEVQLIQAMKQKAIELAQKEQMLNQQMQEVTQMKQNMIIEEGKKSEKEFETQLRAMKLPEEQIQNMLKEYRSKFIKSKIGDENNVNESGTTSATGD